MFEDHLAVLTRTLVCGGLTRLKTRFFKSPNTPRDAAKTDKRPDADDHPHKPSKLTHMPGTNTHRASSDASTSTPASSSLSTTTSSSSSTTSSTTSRGDVTAAHPPRAPKVHRAAPVHGLPTFGSLPRGLRRHEALRVLHVLVALIL